MSVMGLFLLGICGWLVLSAIFGLIAGPVISHGMRQTWE